MRRTPMKRTAFKSKRPAHQPNVEREPRPIAATVILHRGVISMCDDTVRAAPKEKAYRDPALLEMARDRRCLLLAVGNCEGLGSQTTVACHENQGKGLGIKAPDHRSVWGCAACHRWYDESGSPRAEKRRAFEMAYDRQRAMWLRVATDPSEPERFRRAAARALVEGKE